MFNSEILVIDDEKDISHLIEMALRSNGFKNITLCFDGKTALEKINSKKPDLILLDLMLPNIDGLTICREVKSNPAIKNIPIIMITAKSEENDIVMGLELGANDYITKPFSTKVLIARVRNQLRLSNNKNENKNNNSILSFREILINKIQRSVFINNIEIKLTYSEYELLVLFVSNVNRVFTRNQLILYLKGNDGFDINERSIDVQILNLRHKLKEYGSYIEAVRKIGYRLNEKTC